MADNDTIFPRQYHYPRLGVHVYRLSWFANLESFSAIAYSIFSNGESTKKEELFPSSSLCFKSAGEGTRTPTPRGARS